MAELGVERIVFGIQRSGTQSARRDLRLLGDFVGACQEFYDRLLTRFHDQAEHLRRLAARLSAVPPIAEYQRAWNGVHQATDCCSRWSAGFIASR